jgi:hypothetical protein
MKEAISAGTSMTKVNKLHRQAGLFPCHAKEECRLVGLPKPYIHRYIRYFWQGNHHTVIYGVCIYGSGQPYTFVIRCIYR